MEFWLVIFKERNPHAFEAREQKAGSWDETLQQSKERVAF
jgi:hypothetical protein